VSTVGQRRAISRFGGNVYGVDVVVRTSPFTEVMRNRHTSPLLTTVTTRSHPVTVIDRPITHVAVSVARPPVTKVNDRLDRTVRGCLPITVNQQPRLYLPRSRRVPSRNSGRQKRKCAETAAEYSLTKLAAVVACEVEQQPQVGPRLGAVQPKACPHWRL